MKSPVLLLALSLSLCILGQPSVSYAQQAADPDTHTETIEALDQIDQRTPLKSAQGFMRFSELGEYERAAEYLDMRYLPEDLKEVDGAALAQKLYVVVSRKIPINFGALSDDPDGVQGDGLPSYRDSLGTLDTPRGTLSIYLQLIPGENDTQKWKVSNASVAQIPQLYVDYGYSPLVESVREFVPEGSFIGIEYFKWVISVGAGLAAALAWLLIAWPLSKYLTRRNADNTDRVRQYLTRPIPTLIFLLVGVEVLKNLGLGVTATRVAEGGTLVTIAIVWFLFATLDMLRDTYAKFLRTRSRESGLMLVRPVTTTIKVVIAALAIVVWLDNIGINVTALVAGLGVGGLAVALVLQKPLEDIMGAITLYTQQPVTVGQMCVCGDITGTVEEINLRTTRIRTIKNTVVVVPNAVFATASIENVAERNQILHRQTVRLALDTSESLIRSVLEGLRDALAATEKVADDSSRVRLVGFGEFSIDIEVFAHVSTTDWADFLAIAENINLATVKVLERTGATLAIPPR